MALKLVRQWFVAFLVGYSLPSFAQPERGVSHEAASVTIRTTCEAMLPAYCQGKYGFQVMVNGEWRAGPDPGGRSVSGRFPKRRTTRCGTRPSGCSAGWRGSGKNAVSKKQLQVSGKP